MKKAYNSKDIKWMKLSIFGANTFSTCGKSQYMCIILDEEGKVLGIGYNGGPSKMKHCVDGGCPRFKENSPSGSLYDNCIAVHAEINAISHCDWGQRKNCSLYVNGPPCYSCAKVICNSGITKVFYIKDDSYKDFKKVLKLFRKCNVKTINIPKELCEKK